jgi:hypothetical protein
MENHHTTLTNFDNTFCEFLPDLLPETCPSLQPNKNCRDDRRADLRKVLKIDENVYGC